MEKDPLGTIEKCVEAGYKYLQIANGITDTMDKHDLVCGFGVPADVFRDTCERLGVKLLASHFMMTNFTPETARDICKAQKEIGVDGLITPIQFASTPAEVQMVCDECNRLGEICAEEGMSYFYHNHSHEFQLIDGKTFFDRLMEGTDPNLVKLELDTYWATRGGVDPIQIMKDLGERCTLLHQKDYPKGYEDELVQYPLLEVGKAVDLDYFTSQTNPAHFVEIGTGILDIQSIIDTAVELDCYDYIILEQDYTALDEIESIKVSMESFKKYNNVTFS
ncbi:MAG: sugar phosphate isomerase/epimerase [Ruminococcaceae bacterium]|nr:sugar phosphate isomerase/epimerase [Oscillospiraceae bacterium]